MSGTADNNEVININNVSFCYDPGNPVLEKVSLKINALESVCIVGPNGGGKSTLLKMILGELRPDSGKITVFGQPPLLARRRIGYMPQYSYLDKDFPVNVMDVVLMGRLSGSFWGGYSRRDREIAMHALDEMAITELYRRPFASLSGGQRQRVLVARALACEPDILVLDEPTANIDPGVQEHFYGILDHLSKRMTMLIVSHDLGFVSRGVNTVACVNKEVRLHPTSALSGEMINEIYGYDMSMIRHDHRCAAEGHVHG